MRGKVEMTGRECFEKLLGEGTVAVMVHAGPGLVLPARVELPNRLDYGYHQARPPRGLEVTDEGIGAELSFSQEWHKTFVPWGCVHAIALVVQTPVEKPARKLRAM